MYRPSRIPAAVAVLMLVAGAAFAQSPAAAVYRAATGDAEGKCLYAIFTFSEGSCQSCLEEIGHVWCPAQDLTPAPGKIGLLLLFNTPRLSVVEKMRARMQGGGCRAPFVVDTNGALSARLFSTDAAGQMVLVDGEGRTILHRIVGERDELSAHLAFDGGPARTAAYLDSIVRECRAGAATSLSDATGAGAAAPWVSGLRAVDSVTLGAADTVEIPFAFSYAPMDRRYLFVGGFDNRIYLYDSTGRRTGSIRVDTTMTPSAVRLRNDTLYVVGGIVDTLRYTRGPDSILIIDNVITLAKYNMAGKQLSRHRMKPTGPLSLGNDLQIGAASVYVTAQRSVTSSFFHGRGIDRDAYFREIYDPKNYAAYVDTMKLVREFDTTMHLRRSFGYLPRDLASFGFKRSHYWLEYNRWLAELPSGTVAWLHCASPQLALYRDGLLLRTIDLRGDYYQPITGEEKESEIPRFVGMTSGEDGLLYVEYIKPVAKQRYLIVADPISGRRGAVVPMGWNERLVRVDALRRPHVVRTGAAMLLVVCKPIE